MNKISIISNQENVSCEKDKQEVKQNLGTNEIILKEWNNGKGYKLVLGYVKGRYKFQNYPDKEDRLFFIRINDSPNFAITHEQQLELMKNVLGNDILPHRLMQNIEKFLNALYELKGQKKAEYRKYNINLSQFIDRNLWNCGGKNGSS